MKISRRFFLISGLILILLAIPLTVYLLRGNLDFRKEASSAGASFSFDPTGGEIVRGATVEIKILLNTGGKNIIGADSIISFDRNLISVIDQEKDKTGTQIQAGSFFEKPLVLANKVEGDRIYLSINSFTPFKGAGVFGTIKFQAKKSGEVDFKFVSGETKITEQGTAQNILQTMAPAQFNIEGAGGTATTETTASGTPKTTSSADVNDDGKVNELDLQLFSQKLGQKVNITKFDLNKDGQVDSDDFKLFEKAFKGG